MKRTRPIATICEPCQPHRQVRFARFRLQQMGTVVSAVVARLRLGASRPLAEEPASHRPSLCLARGQRTFSKLPLSAPFDLMFCGW